MHRYASRLTATVALSALALAATGLPTQANVNIPEGGAVTPGSVFLINFQAQEGCEGLAMDTLEVTIPEAVDNPVPEDIPGWTVEVETDDDDAVSLVRWSGGPLDSGTFLEFGMRLGFPDEPGATIEFPVVQRCGTEELTSTPTVNLAPRFGPRDLIALSDGQDSLRTEIDELRSRLGNVDPENLRSRVGDTESAIDTIEVRLDEFEARLDEFGQRLDEAVSSDG